MKRTPIVPKLAHIPDCFHALLRRGTLYDSSCSPEAQVIYIDCDDGYFLKTAPKGALKSESELNAYFHAKGLGPEVLDYRSEERDWMLTRRVEGRI